MSTLIDKVSVPEGERGQWKVKRFKLDGPDLRSLLKGRPLPAGEYTQLLYGQHTLVMSDTPAEMRDHYSPVLKARGSCLINGLGLGMVLGAVLKRPGVTDVTVVELHQEVIDLVAPTYTTDPRVQIVCASAYDYQPPKGKRYGMVWHDIWNDICADNLEQMAKLHRKYGRRCDWQGSWAKELCRRGRRS